MIGAIFGVRWLAPDWPTVDHAGGDHATLAAVRGREEMLNAEVLKVAGLSLACPSIVSEVACEVASSTVNWI